MTTARLHSRSGMSAPARTIVIPGGRSRERAIIIASRRRIRASLARLLLITIAPSLPRRPTAKIAPREKGTQERRCLSETGPWRHRLRRSRCRRQQRPVARATFPRSPGKVAGAPAVDTDYSSAAAAAHSATVVPSAPSPALGL